MPKALVAAGGAKWWRPTKVQGTHLFKKRNERIEKIKSLLCWFFP